MLIAAKSLEWGCLVVRDPCFYSCRGELPGALVRVLVGEKSPFHQLPTVKAAFLTAIGVNAVRDS